MSLLAFRTRFNRRGIRMPPILRTAAGAVLAALLLVASGGSASHACSCAPVNEEDMVVGAGLAVLAEAIVDAPFTIPASAVAAEPSWVTIFQVGKVLAGNPRSARIAVLHTVRPSPCGIRFAVGERYLLTFRPDVVAGPLSVNLCGIAPSDIGKLHVR